MSTLLAFETAFGKFSIAIFRDGKLLENFACEKENEQAELLIPSIEDLLKRNKLKYSDITSIAVGTGPGSFTGVRIGLAAAKGIALATKAKLIGVSSLEASAYKQGGGKVYLNAQRGQAYFQEFDKDINPLNEAELITYSGDYSPLPDAESIGYIALKHESRSTSPLYIRRPDAKFSLRTAEIKDVQWLVETHAACFKNKWDEKIIRNTLKNSDCIIADRLGFIVYEIIGDECEIKTICVLPDARRKGVANFMFQQFLNNCRDHNIDKIFLEVETSNDSAIRFYENAGFVRLSERKHYYGQNRHALMMQLAISA